MEESLVFNAAVNLPRERRTEFLEAACADNAQLRAEVEELLREHEEPGSFLDRPAVSPPATDFFSPATEGPDATIGPYKLLKLLGEGGMGVVYVAEQEQPVRRQVALKIIKPGLDSRQIVARFEAERQALAMMDHANIAKVLDAGTTSSGRPYFVMELVKGLPITQYCDVQKLSPRQRLELFIPVCQAIQHAHQKGIIHRDIKPSNVLVTLCDDKPVPKVIDFGVAKATTQALTDKTMCTQLGQLVGTLEYMSPEQASLNQLDVDTRSDIYSMGVLLYELLAGDTPFEKRRLRTVAFDEMLRIIREEEPPRPSTRLSGNASLSSIAANRRTEARRLGPTLRGELDWIVMRALEKDRARRYDSAGSLARDIQRYLNDEAVLAGPPSAWYRFRKFARRNTELFATASLFVAVLLAGIAGTSWQAVRATRSQLEAEEQLLQARRAKQETERVLRRLMKAESAALSSSASLLLEKRNYEQAKRQFQRALELNPDSPLANNNYAWFLATCPDARLRDPQEAFRRASRALDLVPDSGNFLNTLGVAHYRAGNHEQAIGALERSRQLLADDALSYNAFFLAMAYWRQGSKDKGREILAQAVEWMEKNDPRNPELLRFCVEATQLLHGTRNQSPDPRSNPEPRNPPARSGTPAAALPAGRPTAIGTD